ncbi:hypothetical protein LTS12_004219 [Elasticomyces elasticus]|nr:hypothetical protein LTS12_004219 [Elasticomyces elasticus]
MASLGKAASNAKPGIGNVILRSRRAMNALAAIKHEVPLPPPPAKQRSRNQDLGGDISDLREGLIATQPHHPPIVTQWRHDEGLASLGQAGLTTGLTTDGRIVPHSDPTVRPSLLDTPTALIDYWFSHVCQMWSTFDSEVNYKRQIATIYCTSSEVVFTTLQTMSAAALASTVPQLQNLFPLLESRAGRAIAQRVSAIQTLPDPMAGDLTTDLVFALLALGTSLHWARPSRHDHVLYRTVRSLMGRWQTSASNVEPLHFAFFEQALIHWEMLLTISNQRLDLSKIDRRRRRVQLIRPASASIDNDASCGSSTSLQPSAGPEASRGTRPNSSCGISSEVVDLFGQALTLCRIAHARQTDGKAFCIEDAECELAIAHELQRELLELDFEKIVQIDVFLGFPLYTGDQNTPLVHHIYAAEAYSLAALLQLQIAFDDLRGAAALDEGITSQHEQVLLMSAQLVDLLEKIPPDSGLRCIQMVLYISAAAGLKHIPRSTVVGSSDENVSHADVLGLRNAVLHRLSILERNLPRRPVRAAMNLIKAIWTSYDASGARASGIQWLRVMEETGCQTLFW